MRKILTTANGIDLLSQPLSEKHYLDCLALAFRHGWRCRKPVHSKMALNTTTDQLRIAFREYAHGIEDADDGSSFMGALENAANAEPDLSPSLLASIATLRETGTTGLFRIR